MQLRVTARLAQRLGTIAPNQISLVGNSAKSGVSGPTATPAPNAQLCSAKCAVFALWPPASAAWNWGRVLRRCTVSSCESKAPVIWSQAIGCTTVQTARRLRPLARRALITARPPRVFMRIRKPWVRARRILEGWYVRFIVVSALTPQPMKRIAQEHVSFSRLTLNTIRGTRDYRKFSEWRQHLAAQSPRDAATSVQN